MFQEITIQPENAIQNLIVFFCVFASIYSVCQLQTQVLSFTKTHEQIQEILFVTKQKYKMRMLHRGKRGFWGCTLLLVWLSLLVYDVAEI